MDSSLERIQRFQEKKDPEALAELFCRYFPIVQEMIEPFVHPSLDKETVLAKARERFPFIMTKYRADAGMSMEDFLRNTYHYFLRTL